MEGTQGRLKLWSDILFYQFTQEEGAKFAALYWEEPDRSGHVYGPDNTSAMAKVLKEVQSFSEAYIIQYC